MTPGVTKLATGQSLILLDVKSHRLIVFRRALGWQMHYYPTLYRRSGQNKNQITFQTSIVFLLIVLDEMRADVSRVTRVDRPKLFIERLIWVDPATFSKL